MSKIQKFIFLFLILGFITFLFQSFKAERVLANPNQELTIFDQGLEYRIKAQGKTVKEILSNAGIEIQKNDIIFPSLDYQMDIGQYSAKIIIDRAIPITLNIYGKTKTIFTQREKVSEVLREQNIKFQSSDLINYNFDDEIFPGIEIRIWTRPKPKPVIKPIKIVRTGQSQTGIATWYSYIPGNFCASPVFKKGTKLLVTNLANGKKIIVTVNDYGPFNGPIIDLERNAFLKLSPLWKGVIRVKVERVKVL